MKRIFTLTFIVLMQFTMNAQLPNGSIVPNFTATDIDGNEVELYDLLDQGYDVVIDVFATWCGPCWDYHQTHTLQDVWEQYGPEGTNKIYVLGIEGDGSTTYNNLIGIGSGTLGDWTEGITYPIIDKGSLSNLLQISGFPTIYHICTSRTIRDIGQQTNPSFFNDAGDDCARASGANNFGIVDYDGFEGNICSEIEYEPSVQLQNLGSETLTSALIELSINEEVIQSIDWTGMLGTYELETINFEPVAINTTSDISINILNVNDTTDDDDSDNSYTLLIDEAPEIAENNYTVELRTDQYGAENYWAFIDSEGNIAAEGGNPLVGLNNIGKGTGTAPSHPSAYANNRPYTFEVTLPETADCYEFVMTDYYGDGMCCAYGQGSYKVTSEMGFVLAEGGDFGASAREAFGKEYVEMTAVGTNDIDIATNFDVFPNPVQDELNVSFDLTESSLMSIEIFNVLGKVIKSVSNANYSTGNQTLTVPTSDLADGMYIISLRSAQGSISKKFTVAK